MNNDIRLLLTNYFNLLDGILKNCKGIDNKTLKMLKNDYQAVLRLLYAD